MHPNPSEEVPRTFANCEGMLGKDECSSVSLCSGVAGTGKQIKVRLYGKMEDPVLAGLKWLDMLYKQDCSVPGI